MREMKGKNDVKYMRPKEMKKLLLKENGNGQDT